MAHELLNRNATPLGSPRASGLGDRRFSGYSRASSQGPGSSARSMSLAPVAGGLDDVPMKLAGTWWTRWGCDFRRLMAAAVWLCAVAPSQAVLTAKMLQLMLSCHKCAAESSDTAERQGQGCQQDVVRHLSCCRAPRQIGPAAVSGGSLDLADHIILS
jgi:hypothetical protein